VYMGVQQAASMRKALLQAGITDLPVALVVNGSLIPSSFCMAG
jgi:siroheme synthase